MEAYTVLQLELSDALGAGPLAHFGCFIAGFFLLIGVTSFKKQFGNDDERCREYFGFSSKTVRSVCISIIVLIVATGGFKIARGAGCSIEEHYAKVRNKNEIKPLKEKKKKK